MAQEKLKTMLMQSFGVTNKQYHGMLWYFLEWSITSLGFAKSQRLNICIEKVDAKYATCTSPIMHLICLQNFA